MPKKQPRNAYYYFMHDFKEEQRKKGIHYENLAEVAKAASPAWNSAPPAVRAKFDAIAKAEKAKANVPQCKFTSHGVPLSVIEAAEQEKKNAEQFERTEIINFVKLNKVSGEMKEKDIFLMDVNAYCKCNMSYLIGEVTVLRFSLSAGIKDLYHEIIHPGGIPIGYALDVKLGCQDLGLEMPDEDQRRSDYLHILATMVDFMRQKAPKREPLPPLYTMPDKVAPVVDFIQQLCSRTAEDERDFRVYRLDTLLYQLAAGEQMPRESLALAALKKDLFKYSPGLACEMHEEKDRVTECTSSRVKRWAYTVFDMCLKMMDIEPRPGAHVPQDFDIDSIVTYKEERAGSRAGGPRVAGPLLDTSACSTVSDGFNNVRVESKRTYVPMRCPDTDYSRALREAPSLSSREDFPVLSASSGRGRDSRALREAPSLSSREDFPVLSASSGRGRGCGMAPQP